MTATESASFFPREHGATAMLLMPFLCAAILARQVSPKSIALEAAAFVAVAFAFALKDPLVAILRQRFVWKQPHPEVAVAWRWLALELPLFLSSCAILLVYGPWRQYLVLGLCEAAFGTLAVWMNISNRQRSEWFQVVSAVALTATSLAACLAALGEVPVWGWELWVLCALQSTAGILVIHARLEARVSTHRTEPISTRGPAFGQSRDRRHGGCRGSHDVFRLSMDDPRSSSRRCLWVWMGIGTPYRSRRIEDAADTSGTADARDLDRLRSVADRRIVVSYAVDWRPSTRASSRPRKSIAPCRSRSKPGERTAPSA